jgi:hypothetical protein
VPELTSIGDLESSAWGLARGFQLTTDGGPPLNVAFPRLDTVSGTLKVKGNFARYLLLVTLDADIARCADS